MTNADIPRVLEAFGRHLRGEPVPVVAPPAPLTISERLRNARLDMVETVNAQATATLFGEGNVRLGRGPVRYDNGVYRVSIEITERGIADRLCVYDSEGHLTITMEVGGPTRRPNADLRLDNDHVGPMTTVDITLNFWSTD